MSGSILARQMRVAHVLLAAAALVVSPVLGDSPPPFLLKWGGTGSGDGQFLKASRAACAPSGEIYVSDPQLARVQKFTSDGGFVLGWSDPSVSSSFGGIDVDLSGRVYVSFDNVVKVSDPHGTLLSEYPIGIYGAAIAVDAPGEHFYAVVANVVRKYSTETGLRIGQWITNAGTFAANTGVAVGPSGDVYVVESWASRVYKYTGDGVFVTSWDGSGSAGDRLDQPTGIDVDANEHVYVTDVGNAQIQKFTSTGGFLTKWGSSGSGDGQFYFPTDVALDGDGNVYVVDQTLNRVQKFGDAATPAAPASWGQLKAKYRGGRAVNDHVKVIHPGH